MHYERHTIYLVSLFQLNVRKRLIMFGMQKMCEQNLCKEEINKYKRAFAIFDAEGEGTITTEVIQITL